MAENEVTVLPVATMPNVDKHQGTDLERRFAREDQGAAIEVLAHRRQGMIEEAVQEKSKQAGKLRKEAEEVDTELTQKGLDHSVNLDYTALDAAAAALEAANVGNYASAAVTINRDDEKEQFVFNIALLQLPDEASNKIVDIKTEITETRRFKTSESRSYSQRTYSEVVGNKIEIKVDYADIDGVTELKAKLETVNEQIKKTEEELSKAQRLQAQMPRFRQELKVTLAERQLGETDQGKSMLEAIQAKAAEGLEGLVALPPAAEDTPDEAETATEDEDDDGEDAAE